MARLRKLTQSPYWERCAVFIVWDDWGGWYDHLEPPLQESWTGGSPDKGPNYTGTQFAYGPRVPCLIVSPYARRGINSNFHSHASIIKFCEKNFNLPSLNARDVIADDMTDCFNPNQSPLDPPVI